MNKRERVLQAVKPQETDFVLYDFRAVLAVRERLCQQYCLSVTTRRWLALAATPYEANRRHEPETPRKTYYSRLYRDIFCDLRVRLRDLPSVG